eukprot:TRINITY_DN385_c3_g1_i3.p1 TRINITY_DN385_c3_g1~~TRINITY_DN385_c3_g1_i3.p1  ORF type:complete len:965 (+),score=330.12 TRINITY_DN385_c3_g1_i3:268-2895(+)
MDASTSSPARKINDDDGGSLPVEERKKEAKEDKKRKDKEKDEKAKKKKGVDRVVLEETESPTSSHVSSQQGVSDDESDFESDDSLGSDEADEFGDRDLTKEEVKKARKELHRQRREARRELKRKKKMRKELEKRLMREREQQLLRELQGVEEPGEGSDESHSESDDSSSDSDGYVQDEDEAVVAGSEKISDTGKKTERELQKIASKVERARRRQVKKQLKMERKMRKALEKRQLREREHKLLQKELGNSDEYESSDLESSSSEGSDNEQVDVECAELTKLSAEIQAQTLERRLARRLARREREQKKLEKKALAEALKREKREKEERERQQKEDAKREKREKEERLKQQQRDEKKRKKEDVEGVKAKSKLVKERAKDIKLQEKARERLDRNRKELSQAQFTFEVYHLRKKPVFIELPSFRKPDEGSKSSKKESTKKGGKVVDANTAVPSAKDAGAPDGSGEPPRSGSGGDVAAEGLVGTGEGPGSGSDGVVDGLNVMPPVDEQPFFRVTSHRIILRAKSSKEQDHWMSSIQKAISIPYKSFPCMLPEFTALPDLPGESCEWLNNLLRRYFKDMKYSLKMHESIAKWLQTRFDRMKQQSFLGPITVQAVDLGTDFLTFKRIKLVNSNVPDELVGEFEMNYSGGCSVTVTHDIYVNWPYTKFATIPCVAFVQMVSICGVVRIYAPPEAFGRFALSFVEQPKSKFNFKLVVGSRRYQVHNLIPKVGDFIESALRKLIYKHAVTPNLLTFALPTPGNKLRMKAEKYSSRRSRARREREREAERLAELGLTGDADASGSADKKSDAQAGAATSAAGNAPGQVSLGRGSKGGKDEKAQPLPPARAKMDIKSVKFDDRTDAPLVPPRWAAVVVDEMSSSTWKT